MAYFTKCNQNNLDIAHTNSNSLTNKFELLAETTKGNINIMLISKTKIGKSFPTVRSKLMVLVTPTDRNKKGGGISLLFREDLPLKDLLVDKGNESCYVEVILNKTK